MMRTPDYSMAKAVKGNELKPTRTYDLALLRGISVPAPPNA